MVKLICFWHVPQISENGAPVMRGEPIGTLTGNALEPAQWNSSNVLCYQLRN